MLLKLNNTYVAISSISHIFYQESNIHQRRELTPEESEAYRPDFETKDIPESFIIFTIDGSKHVVADTDGINKLRVWIDANVAI